MTLKILSNAREGEILHDISYMWNLKRNDTNKLTKQTEREKKIFRFQMGRRGDRGRR